MDYFDIVNGDHQDLANDAIFSQLVARVEAGEYHAALLSPPCSTFSGARKEHDGGPRPLRDPAGPGLRGRKGLSVEEREAVRLGTLLAVRASQLATAMQAAGKAWILENPPCRDGKPSLFNLSEWKELWEAADAIRSVLPQCQFGCAFEKPTELRGRADFPPHLSACQHEHRWWRLPPRGRWLRAAHPPLMGKLVAVAEEDWSDQVHPYLRTHGLPYLTRATAAYPAEFNDFLADALLRPLSREASDAASPPSVTPPVSGEPADAKAPRVRFSLPLRETEDHREAKEKSELLAVGGMRHPARAATRIPSLRDTGKKVRALLDRFIELHPHVVDACNDAIGGDDEGGPGETDLQAVRAGLARLLDAPSAAPLLAKDHNCTLCGPLLEAWARASGDPDTDAARWPSQGAPAGILCHPEQLGIFPDAQEPHDLVDPLEASFPDPEFRASYASVESDDHATEELDRLVQAGFLCRFDSLADCQAFLDGQNPVVSKFGMVVKVKDGRTKRRLILDAKESGVTACARKNQRILLPTCVDLIHSCLRQQALWARHGGAAAAGQRLLVLDVKDAFWTLPCKAEERRFLVGKHRGVYFVYLRLAQGSRGAPLAWGRFIALVARLTQALFEEWELLLQVYVDDPGACLSGEHSHQRRVIAVLVLCWRALNLALSFRKGALSSAVNWIGAHLEVRPGGVDGSIKRESVQEIREEVQAMLGDNVVGRRRLVSLAGKISNVARLLTAWRPFLQDIWAAIFSEDGSAPSGCIWTKRIVHALSWFRAFLTGSHHGLVRPFDLEHFISPDFSVETVIDASPWGFGGILCVGGVIQEFFGTPLTAEDTARFGFEIADPAGQQTWECLCCLIALRQWAPAWRRCRSTVCVKGDNVTMLNMVLKLQVASSAKHLGLIARELALDCAEACYRPVASSHLPGLANVTADRLSRLSQPGKVQELPSEVRKARRVAPPARCASYFRTLAPHPSHPLADASLSPP